MEWIFILEGLPLGGRAFQPFCGAGVGGRLSEKIWRNVLIPKRTRTGESQSYLGKAGSQRKVQKESERGRKGGNITRRTERWRTSSIYPWKGEA